MFDVRKYVYLVMGFCFLIGALSFNLWAKDVANEGASNLQKTGILQEQAPWPNQPHISFDAISYDVGEVWEGDVISHTFVVKNTGTSELTISKVKAG